MLLTSTPHLEVKKTKSSIKTKIECKSLVLHKLDDQSKVDAYFNSKNVNRFIITT